MYPYPGVYWSCIQALESSSFCLKGHASSSNLSPVLPHSYQLYEYTTQAQVYLRIQAWLLTHHVKFTPYLTKKCSNIISFIAKDVLNGVTAMANVFQIVSESSQQLHIWRACLMRLKPSLRGTTCPWYIYVFPALFYFTPLSLILWRSQRTDFMDLWYTSLVLV